ncbi:class I SAM-dependent methyltransferase [Heliomicrobium gestii]|uniref:class I SAM-dependent methyltransferase n=1 Tax=Heliomicrobium gestii TaxID=2699 RepID=UPI001959EFF9|nr:class I SAM-dependent methyltransferase [Heliomicrobium gestii]MBM7867590.1 trans-aconitate methyltransferase [Heliomicrobium gestii]
MLSYEFDGHRYKEASRLMKEWGRRQIAELSLTGRERILDLGCGDGVLSKQLADLVPQGSVLGVDASVGMIRTAKELEAGNLTFQLLDINKMVFEEEFDLIFSNAALNWIFDHDRLLKSVYQALKPGGKARFNFAGQGNGAHYLAVITATMAEPAYRPYFENFQWPWFLPSADEYRQVVARQGFREATVWGEATDRRFIDTEELIRWLDQPALVPFIKHIPDDRKTVFRDTVVNRMIEGTRQPDGSHRDSFQRINLLARK